KGLRDAIGAGAAGRTYYGGVRFARAKGKRAHAHARLPVGRIAAGPPDVSRRLPFFSRLVHFRRRQRRPPQAPVLQAAKRRHPSREGGAVARGADRVPVSFRRARSRRMARARTPHCPGGAGGAWGTSYGSVTLLLRPRSLTPLGSAFTVSLECAGVFMQAQPYRSSAGGALHPN